LVRYIVILMTQMVRKRRGQGNRFGSRQGVGRSNDQLTWMVSCIKGRSSIKSSKIESKALLLFIIQI
jgi:hypothetical protein